MDDSTKRSLTILATVAVVLVALFVFSVVFRPSCSCGTRESWRARLLGEDPVGPGQLGGCTTKLGTFTFTGACKLRIAAADVRSRRLVIESNDRVQLIRVMDADDRPITMKPELNNPDQKKPIKSTDFSIGKKGEAVDLICKSGGSCSVTLR